MPILDQGYQHWNGTLEGHAWRWLAIARQGARAQLTRRGVWAVLGLACFPALILAGFLVLWGLFEQKSSLLTPLLFLVQGLPSELRDGPKGFRGTFWTLAFNTFLDVQLYLAMLLVLLVGPELISQDLRFNAMPLYLSRPVRRFDYFAGKLGVIAVYLAAVMILPLLLAFFLGFAFSLDPRVVRDTWHVLAGSLAYGAIVVLSAGTLMLALSSLSRNSRYVGAMWVGVCLISSAGASVLDQTVHRDWCPLVSYTGNLSRLRDALLDTGTAWRKLSSLIQAGQDQLRDAGRSGPFRRSRRGRMTFTLGGPPPPPAPPRPPGAVGTTTGPGPPGQSATYPWQWSAWVLTGLGALSLWILATRVRSLDRLR
jgi:ABC-2 type transport system permease protein